MTRPSQDPPPGADFEQRKKWLSDLFVYYLDIVDEWHRSVLTEERKRELCELLNTDRAFRDIYGFIFFGEKATSGGVWPVASPQTLPRCSPAQLQAFVEYVARSAVEAKSRRNPN